MFWNYLKIAQRNILKRKAFSLINIIGLSVSIAVSILILLYVIHEISFDKYHANAKNKYRVILKVIDGKDERETYVTNGTLVDKIKENVPGIKNSFQAYVEFPYVQYEDKSFLEDNDDVYYVGEGIIEFLSVKFISGDPKTALKEPYSLVLTESYAKKYFGKSSVLGKTLILESKNPYKVTGVVKDLPNNTHFKFNILLSLPSLSKTYGLSDLTPFRNSFINYIELDEKENVDIIGQKLTKVSNSFLPPQAKEMGFELSNYLQPITDIHLKSSFNDRFKGGDIKTVYIFSSIAILILILACINYINLSTAQYSSRTKEVAIRKTSGANKKHLIKQFITESFIITVVSLATALVIAEFFLPLFNSLIGFKLKIAYFDNWYNIILIIGVGLLVGTFSSTYPAFFLSSFNVVDVFRMKTSIGRSNINIRRALVVFQFAVTIFLIISSLVLYKQLEYIDSKDLGFDKKNLMGISLNNNQARSQVEILKSEIDQLPFVVSSSVNSNYPSGDATWENVFTFEDYESEQFPVMPLLDVDYDFLKTMKIRLKEGRNFSEDFTTDSSAVLVNERLVKLVGWENAIGKHISEQTEFSVENYKIIGVFRDYHKESLHSEIQPMIVRLAERKRFILVRLDDGYTESSINKIKGIWEKLSPGKPFQNMFIDDEFDKLYKSERNLSNIFVYFSVVAIIIACLGLLGLIIFYTQQKTKEISLRKILGAKTNDIIYILTKEFILLQMISNIIAIPLVYYAMNKWIHSFTYHTSIHWWVYLIGTLISAIISVFAISLQTHKAAMANPAENLRYE